MIELRVYANSLLSIVPSPVFWLLIVALCVGTAGLLWWKGLREGIRYSAVLLLSEWVMLLLAITLVFRDSGAGRRINLVPLSSYFDIAENSYFREVVAINILNVVLFFPIGLLLGWGFRNMTWQRVLAIGAALSASVELLQLLFRKGLCETDDVIHNVLGCMIGYGVYMLTSIMFSRGSRFSSSFAINHLIAEISEITKRMLKR